MKLIKRKEFMKIHRHGEVILIQRELPKKAKQLEETKSFVVGHSESGHHHVLTSTSPFKVYELEGKTYLELSTEAKLKHQKTGTETHGIQKIKPGIYERLIKRSYSYGEKIMRRVQD